MKVLLIDVNFKNSSTGKIVHDLAKELLDNGHEAKVLYGRGSHSEESFAKRIAHPLEVYFHALMTRVTGLIGFFSYFATKRLIREIKNFKPDVVNLHELHGYYVNYSAVLDFLKKESIPIVWTFHCEFAYTGKCGYAYDCEKWKTECHACPQLKEYPSTVFFDFTRHMFNQKKLDFEGLDNLVIVTPSQWLANRVRQSILKRYEVRVIHNGIDVDNTFFPRLNNTCDQSLKRKKILAVAPDIMSERKGGKWVLKVAERLPQFDFIMVGSDYIDSAPANVSVISKTSNQDELAEYYSSADVFLICSKRENFPTTCIEALACGTPVIGFDEGGTAETAPGLLGEFVSYGDIDALEEVLNSYLLGDSAINRDLCRPFALENYSKKVMANKYMQLYKYSSSFKEI